jgi:hypothetical protein
MTTSTTTLFYYDGFMWRTVLGAGGRRVARSFRLTDGELVTHATKEARQP